MRLTVSSTLPIQQVIAYSISCSKAEKEIDLLQDGGKILKGKNIDHHSPRIIPNICHLPDPPTLIHTVYVINKEWKLFLTLHFKN